MFAPWSLIITFTVSNIRLVRGDPGPYVALFNDPGTTGPDEGSFLNSLPIGNGRIGASVYGQPANEVITINEDSIWSGNQMDRVNRDGPAHLQDLRDALLSDDVSDAANIAYSYFVSNPTTSRSYAFLADLAITLDHSDYSNYQRSLDIQNAVTGCTYTSNGVHYTRQWIVSNPAKAVVGSFTASQSGSLSLTVQWNRTGLDDGSRDGNLTAVGNNGAVIFAGLPSGAPNYSGYFSVVPSGGSVSSDNGVVTVSNADSVLIIVTAETDYWNEGFDSSSLQELVQSEADNITNADFSDLLSQHISDFTGFFDRAVLSVDSPSTNYSLDLPSRFSAYQNGAQDQALETFFWSLGRYLMISSSRAGSLPPNLIGIWQNNDYPNWGGKFTTDLNVEMNHWLTETTGLSEMSMQLFDFTLNRVVPNGQFTAQTLYNCSGWMSHHNNDLWGDTAPHDDGTAYSWFTQGGTWPMTHLYEHYRFTGDTDFLSNTALPILNGLMEFYNDFLIERDGYLVTAPSASTENGYITPNGTYEAIAIGPTADNYFLTEIFTNFLNASSITGSTYMVDEVTYMLSKIRTPFMPNYFGGIRQWWDDWQEQYQSDEMIDSILGLYPFGQISVWQPESNVTQMAEAQLSNAMNELGGNSWSVVWPIAYYARLWQGNNAYSYIQRTLQTMVSTSALPWTMNQGSHQIDGNLGYTAGVTEMILQSHGPGETWPLMLLPALPSAWPTGYASGLGARGGFDVNVEWSDGAFVQANIYSKLGSYLNVTVFNLPNSGNGFSIQEVGLTSSNGYVAFQSSQGTNYTVVPN